MVIISKVILMLVMNNYHDNYFVILINLSVMWIASIAAPGLAKTRELGQYTFYVIIHDDLGWFLGNLVSTHLFYIIHYGRGGF